MTRSWTALLLLLAPLAGCGPTVCDYAEEWAGRCDVSWTEADTQSCTATYKTCTQREKARLDAWWLCLDGEGYFECRDATSDTGATGAPADVGAALLACQDELQGVSIECGRAIGLEGGTFAGLETTPTDSGTPTN